MKNQNLKVRDKVQITKGSPDEKGRIGRITIVSEKIIIVKLSKYNHVMIRKNHLKKVK